MLCMVNECGYDGQQKYTICDGLYMPIKFFAEFIVLIEPPNLNLPIFLQWFEAQPPNLFPPIFAAVQCAITKFAYAHSCGYLVLYMHNIAVYAG